MKRPVQRGYVNLLAILASASEMNMPDRAAYLDYQASTPLDPAVCEVMLRCFAAPGNPSSEEHAFGWAFARTLEHAREQVAWTLGALAEEVTFTSGATEANNIAVMGAAMAAAPGRRRILISALEHKSVSECAHAVERMGFQVEVLPCAPNGQIVPETLAAYLADDVAVVSIMAVNNEIGTFQPIAELGKHVRAAGGFFHVDATQALAALDVDVGEWGADALSLSGHKIYGPQGVGALYVALDAPWRPLPLFYGGGQENGLRPGTVPVALCAGLGEACRLIKDRGATEREEVARLRDALEAAVRDEFPDTQVTCVGTPRHPGSLHLRLPGVNAADLLLKMQPRIAASTGSACTSGLIGQSHVTRAIGMTEKEAGECLRFSVGRFSTAHDIEVAGDALRCALQRSAA